MSTDSSVTSTHSFTTEERKVVLSTMAGTTIEWYDFFIYAQAASLVFAPLFIAPATEGSDGFARIISLATIGISFLFRPLGAIVAGRFGDRIGRKKMLVFTLLMMGGATVAIGLLPTYASIGIAAPIILIILRILQGFSAGGEWGGAALMAVEHAPTNRRGLFGAYPQIGVPVGLILATTVLLGLSTVLSEEQFLSWGWRVPFVISVFLIIVGYIIRQAVEESPVFKKMLTRKKDSHTPLADLMKRNWKEVILTALIFIGINAGGYMMIAFFIPYGSGTLEMSRTSVLWAVLAGSVSWFAFTLYGGSWSDRIGRRKVFQIGYILLIVWMIPMFLLIDTANILLFTIALLVMNVGLGLSYGPMPAMYAEMFPVQVRYSGVSIGYAAGAILGGAFAPTIAEILMQSTGWSGSVGIYLMVACVISLVAVTLAGETKGRDLNSTDADMEHAQMAPSET